MTRQRSTANAPHMPRRRLSARNRNHSTQRARLHGMGAVLSTSVFGLFVNNSFIVHFKYLFFAFFLLFEEREDRG